MKTFEDIQLAISNFSDADQPRLIESETPEMLAAIDEGLRSLEENGGIEFTQEELLAKVRQWAGVSS